MFKYVVEYLDTYQNAATPTKDCGIVAADDWGEAIERVRSWYGKGNIISVTLEEWEYIASWDDIKEGFNG